MTKTFTVPQSECRSCWEKFLGLQVSTPALLVIPVMRLLNQCLRLSRKIFGKLIRINKGGNCQPQNYKFKYAFTRYFIQQTSECSHDPSFMISTRDKKMNKTWSPF